MRAQRFQCVALCPTTEQQLAVGSQEGDVLLLDLDLKTDNHKEQLLVLPTDERPVHVRSIVALEYSGACTGDDAAYCGRSRLAVAKLSGRVSVHDMKSLACIAWFDPQTESSNSGLALSFSPGNCILATGGGGTHACKVRLEGL